MFAYARAHTHTHTHAHTQEQALGPVTPMVGEGAPHNQKTPSRASVKDNCVLAMEGGLSPQASGLRDEEDGLSGALDSGEDPCASARTHMHPLINREHRYQSWRLLVPALVSSCVRKTGHKPASLTSLSPALHPPCTIELTRAFYVNTATSRASASEAAPPCSSSSHAASTHRAASRCRACLSLCVCLCLKSERLPTMTCACVSASPSLPPSPSPSPSPSPPPALETVSLGHGRRDIVSAHVSAQSFDSAQPFPSPSYSVLS